MTRSLVLCYWDFSGPTLSPWFLHIHNDCKTSIEVYGKISVLKVLVKPCFRKQDYLRCYQLIHWQWVVSCKQLASKQVVSQVDPSLHSVFWYQDGATFCTFYKFSTNSKWEIWAQKYHDYITSSNHCHKKLENIFTCQYVIALTILLMLASTMPF